MKKKNAYILVVSIIILCHIFAAICFIIFTIIYSIKIHSLNHDLEYFVVKKARVIGQNNIGECSITTKLLIDNQSFHIDDILECGNYDVWFNNKTNKVYLKQGSEDKQQFYMRKKDSYFKKIFNVSMLFLAFSILDILNIKFLKPLITSRNF